MTRIGVIGVSHWHTRLFTEPLLRRDDITFVGVSDSSAEPARRWGEQLGCPAFTDYRDLCADARPDFVFVLGMHSEMAAQASFLIEQGIPFAIEKPAGLNGSEVAEIAAQAAARGAFAAVPFVFRQSDFVARLQEHSNGERFDHLSFTMIGRPPEQYVRFGSEWMLDPARSGGGALINLGVHFLDLVPYLVPDEPVEVVGAATSNGAWGLPIEDFAAVTLKLGSSIATIQTGYQYTAAHEYMDMHFSLRTDSAYYVVRNPKQVEVYSPDGAQEVWDVGTTNIDYYPGFVDDVLARSARGDTPLADLGDAARAMRILDEVYARSGAQVTASDGETLKGTRE